MPTDQTQKPRILVAIQARAASTRWPNKYRTLLPHVYARCIQGPYPVAVVHPGDQVGPWCEARKIPHIPCPPNDRNVLRQLLDAMYVADAEILIQITGDCPLINPDDFKKAVQELETRSFTYLNYGWSGREVRAVKRRALEAAFAQITYATEHGTTWFYASQCRNDPTLRGTWTGNGEARPKLSVDTESEWKAISTLIEEGRI